MTETKRDDTLEAGVTTSFGGRLTYGAYLAVPDLLALQRTVSGSHDELLFIVVHQATELWMKLMLHELETARELIARDDLQPSFKMTARVSRIQEQLIRSWDVLSTMTPSDYLTFRDQLGPASGFQSHQYRKLEFILGNKSAAKLAVFAEQPAVLADLEAERARPSIYDEAIRLLSRRGLPIDSAVLGRDVGERHEPHASVRAAWASVYSRPEQWFDLYELAEELVDVEDWFRQWRFRHVTTVERIIGHKTGTGGTSGVGYLRRALDYTLFPELWEARTDL
jgi:tryptophan 2,3-dioxygenase